MREVLYKVMCRISLPVIAENSFLVILFDEIVARATGYYTKSISRAYSEFLRNNKEEC